MSDLTLREAAAVAGVNLAVIRKRVDRGTLPASKRPDGQRVVTREALEAAGLVPDRELVELRAVVRRLTGELETHRRLVAAERDGRDLVEAALVEERSRAQAEHAKAELVRAELERLDHELASAGMLRAWRIARERRRAASLTPSDG